MSRKHAHNPTYKATEKSKTAQYANPRHSKPTKQERNLERRIAAARDIVGHYKPGSLQ
jgi:hypothetical protein